MKLPRMWQIWFSFLGFVAILLLKKLSCFLELVHYEAATSLTLMPHQSEDELGTFDRYAISMY